MLIAIITFFLFYELQLEKKIKVDNFDIEQKFFTPIWEISASHLLNPSFF